MFNVRQLYRQGSRLSRAKKAGHGSAEKKKKTHNERPFINQIVA